MSDLPTPPPAQPQVVYVESPKKKRGIFKKLLLGFGALFVLIIVAGIAMSGDGEPDTGTNASSPSARESADTAVATSEPTRAAISYEQMIADTEGMTDAQFDKYAEAAKENNRAERWSATVIEVDDQVLGSEYFAHLTTEPGDPFEVTQISIDIPEDLALSLNLGDEIVFSGEIRDFTNTFDLPTVYLQNVTIHDS